MNKDINLKAIIVVIISMVLGVYVIFFQDQIIAGLIIIAGGVSLNFLEVIKWVKELIDLFKSSDKDKEDDQDQHPAPVNRQTHYHQNKISVGDNATFKGDVAMGESKIDKK